MRPLAVVFIYLFIYLLSK